MASSSPVVSVVLVTCNQARYVGQALEGVLAQQFGGDSEVVVADDDSTDGTQDVVESFRGAFGGRLRLLPREPNMGVTRNYQRVFGACRGAFTAVIEGDDFWTAPTRLQQHLDVFRANAEVVLCFNRATVWHEDAGRSTLSRNPLKGSQAPFATFTGAALARGNFITGFSACTYRTAVLQALDPAVYDGVAYDWIINLMCARRGLIGYLPEPLSTYRIHSRGVWSSKGRIEQLRGILSQVPAYDRLTEGQFRPELEDFTRDRVASLLMACWNAGAWRPLLSTSRQYPRIVARIVGAKANPFRALKRARQV